VSPALPASAVVASAEVAHPTKEYPSLEVHAGSITPALGPDSFNDVVSQTPFVASLLKVTVYASVADFFSPARFTSSITPCVLDVLKTILR